MDQGYMMSLSAEPGTNDDGYRLHNTRVPTACAGIIGGPDMPSGDLPGLGRETADGHRGGIYAPFFVAISGREFPPEDDPCDPYGGL